jgi:antitoxin (DNA-binding transcriptional repressor) of toxin-antitoxin stability system
METVSVTTARQNLGAWLARAAKGEEIGIISGSQIIALRPVAVTAADYAFQEYGLKPDEMNRITAKLHEEVSTAAAIPYAGSLAAALAAAGDADQKVSRPSKGSARHRASSNRRRAPLTA